MRLSTLVLTAAALLAGMFVPHARAEDPKPICRNCWEVPCPKVCDGCTVCRNCVEVPCGDSVKTVPPKAAVANPNGGGNRPPRPLSTRPPVFNGGLLDQGPGFTRTGPAATGSPVAPSAPAAPTIR